MNKLEKNAILGLGIITLSLSFNLSIAKSAQAKPFWENTPFDPGTWHEDLENTPFDSNTWTKTANDTVKQAEIGLKKLGGHIVEGLKSGMQLCQEVGFQNCADTNFLQTYVGMKQAANFGVFRGVEPCGQFVYQAVEVGSYGAQAYAQSQGVTIPPQAMNIGKQQYRKYGALSCKVLYGSLPSTQPQGSITNTGGYNGGGQYPGINGQEYIRGIKIEQNGMTERTRLEQDGMTERNRYEWDKKEAINQYQWDKKEAMNRYEWRTRNQMNRREWTTRERMNQTEWHTKDRMNERDNQTVRMGYDHEKELLLLQMQNQHTNPWQNFNYR